MKLRDLLFAVLIASGCSQGNTEGDAKRLTYNGKPYEMASASLDDKVVYALRQPVNYQMINIIDPKEPKKILESVDLNEKYGGVFFYGTFLPLDEYRIAFNGSVGSVGRGNKMGGVHIFDTRNNELKTIFREDKEKKAPDLEGVVDGIIYISAIGKEGEEHYRISPDGKEERIDKKDLPFEVSLQKKKASLTEALQQDYKGAYVQYFDDKIVLFNYKNELYMMGRDKIGK